MTQFHNGSLSLLSFYNYTGIGSMGAPGAPGALGAGALMKFLSWIHIHIIYDIVVFIQSVT